MPPPAILTQHSGAGLERYLRSVTGTSDAFAPSNMIAAMVTPDRAVDVVAGRDLIRQAGTCRRVAIGDFGGAPLWGLEVTQGQNQGAWVCSTIGAWSASGSQAAILVMKLLAEGVGGTFIGPLKGPNKNNPHSGDGHNTYGSDRGWTLSSNGGGRLGFAHYGTENIADQDARTFRPNVDMSTNTTSLVGRGYRVVIVGYAPNFGGAGVGAGYMWTADATQCPVEYCDPGQGIGSAGDISSPDGRMAFGAVMYGSNATASTPWVTYASAVLAHCSFFEGAAAESVHAHRAAIVAAVQADIDARAL